MIIIAIISVLVATVILLLLPEKYTTPRCKPKIRKRKRNYEDGYWTGLPWQGGEYIKKKPFWEKNDDNDNFWKPKDFWDY